MDFEALANYAINEGQRFNPEGLRMLILCFGRDLNNRTALIKKDLSTTKTKKKVSKQQYFVNKCFSNVKN